MSRETFARYCALAYRLGASLNEIAHMANTNPVRVRYHLLSQGVTMRPRGRPKGSTPPAYARAGDEARV